MLWEVSRMALSELRRDYLIDRFVVVPTENGNGNGNGNGHGHGNGHYHHGNGNGNGHAKRHGKCLYCPGNEHLTSPAVLAMVQRDGMYQMLCDGEGDHVKDWSVRVFPSTEPAVSTAPNVSYGDEPLYREPAYGFHYVVVAAPDHKQRLSNMPIDQWANVLLVIQDRVKWLYAQKRVNYVSIFASYGKNGNSIGEHSHINLVTFPTIPPTILQEAKAAERVLEDSGTCPVCNVVNVETNGPREILSTQHFIAMCPWASTCPYEFWIVPKRHSSSFTSITQMEINDLAMILRSTLGGLCRTLKDSYFNLAFHLSPEKKNNVMIHWHVEVYPQISNWAGFERAFGVYMSNVSPEHAAQELRPNCREEFAKSVGV
jgi:UDPglucose--hexose-1-phosphate uridylyltransferase